MISGRSHAMARCRSKFPRRTPYFSRHDPLGGKWPGHWRSRLDRKSNGWSTCKSVLRTRDFRPPQLPPLQYHYCPHEQYAARFHESTLVAKRKPTSKHRGQTYIFAGRRDQLSAALRGMQTAVRTQQANKPSIGWSRPCAKNSRRPRRGGQGRGGLPCTCSRLSRLRRRASRS